MKKSLSILLTILSLILILDSFNAGNAIVMFFLVGAIPGTSLTIDASLALALFASLTGFVLARVVVAATGYRLAKYSLPKAATLAE